MQSQTGHEVTVLVVVVAMVVTDEIMVEEMVAAVTVTGRFKYWVNSVH